MGTNEKLWVAGGAGGAGNDHKIATSSNGVEWTVSTSGDLAFAGGSCAAVAYGNGLWVAGGGYGSDHTIAYSSDGKRWTGSTSGDLAFAGGFGCTVAYNGIAGASGLWVAGGGFGSSHKIAYSSNGVEWTGSTSGDLAFAGGVCSAVAYNGIAGASGLWVAGGGYGAHKIATSSDGISWTGSASGDAAFAGGQCNAVAYNGIAGASGLWVAGGQGTAHKIVTSSDGISWTGSASGDAAFAGGVCSAVAYGKGLWVAGGYGDAHKIATSSDGISWTGSASGDEAFTGGFGCDAVAYNGIAGASGLWVAGGGNGSAHKIATSSDGVEWTARTSGDLAFAGGKCTAVAFGETYIPPPAPAPGVAYIPSVESSFNIFRTNFSGMGNLGEYY